MGGAEYSDLLCWDRGELSIYFSETDLSQTQLTPSGAFVSHARYYDRALLTPCRCLHARYSGILESVC